MDVQTKHDILRTVEDRGKSLLCAKKKSYFPNRLAQQHMTLSDLEWPFHASRAISAVAELLVTCSLSDYFISLDAQPNQEDSTNFGQEKYCKYFYWI